MQQSVFDTITASTPLEQKPIRFPSFFSFNRKPRDKADELIAAQRAHTRALNSNFSCLIIVLLVLFCPIWIPMVLVLIGIIAAAGSSSSNYESPQSDQGYYEPATPAPEPAPVYVAPEPAPVYVAPEPAPVYVAPEPTVYTLPVQLLKTWQHRIFVYADIRVTNTSPLPIKFLMLQMEYTDQAGNYLGVADVAFHGIPVGQSSIGKATILGTNIEQIGGYLLRLDTVTGEDGFLTQHFAINETR